MLLGALIDAGVPLAVLQDAVDAVGTEPIALEPAAVTRHGIGATHIRVRVAESATRRTLPDVLRLLEGLTEQVRTAATDVFTRLCTSTRSAPSTRSRTWSASAPGSSTSG
jgi:uncharacterized protein (DUF111 family)